MRPRLTLPCLAVVALAASACGGDGRAGGAPPGSALVDTSGERPWVNSLEADPSSGDLLLTTNRGFFRISGGRATRVQSRVEDEAGSSPVGNFLEISVQGPGELVGSGHPEDEQALPEYLGLIRSSDGGRTWKVVSRLGESDLHQIRLAHQRLYAFDAVTGAIVTSQDGGRSFQEHPTPDQAIVDFVVDPRDPEHLLASTEDTLFSTTDGGRTWRPVDQAQSAALTWETPGRAVRAERDGTVSASTDGGRTWERIGQVPGEPAAFEALGPQRLLLALADGTIVETSDGGRNWRTRFRP